MNEAPSDIKIDVIDGQQLGAALLSVIYHTVVR